MSLSVTDLLPLAAFAFAMSITPGPNNFMLLNSGVHFGVRRSMPHALGVGAGFVVLLVLAFLGVAAVLLVNPAVMTLLSVACAGYLFWLALRLLRAATAANAMPAAGANGAPLRPMSFFAAVLFQFVNPKAWAMAVACVAIASRWEAGPVEALLALLVVAAGVNLPCVGAWMLGGAALRRRLEGPRARRAFDLAMAVVVSATALWMIWPLAPS